MRIVGSFFFLLPVPFWGRSSAGGVGKAAAKARQGNDNGECCNCYTMSGCGVCCSSARPGQRVWARTKFQHRKRKKKKKKKKFANGISEATETHQAPDDTYLTYIIHPPRKPLNPTAAHRGPCRRRPHAAQSRGNNTSNNNNIHPRQIANLFLSLPARPPSPNVYEHVWCLSGVPCQNPCLREMSTMPMCPRRLAEDIRKRI
ncbi:hypothetical protein K456DRAFT_1369488 [Colletotrichum gloeosporioides 23]|nr:hypothetical protein K456DRAFT_1369488 [Colletotrichum gloeosporioides 23]